MTKGQAKKFVLGWLGSQLAVGELPNTEALDELPDADRARIEDAMDEVCGELLRRAGVDSDSDPDAILAAVLRG